MNSLYHVAEVNKPENENVKMWTGKQVLAAFTLSIASVMIGYSAAFAGAAIASLKNRNESFILEGNNTILQEDLMYQLRPIFAIFGGMAAGPLIECIGRKATLVAASPPTTIAWLSIGLAGNLPTIYFGRSLGGFLNGLMSLCIPIYLGEVLHPHVRGSLGLMPTILGNSALVLCNVLKPHLSWRGLAFVGSLFPVPFVCLMVFVPETPRWYTSASEPENAEQALQWLRGSKASITAEITAIENLGYEPERFIYRSFWRIIWRKINLKPTVICMGLMFFQQMSGINSVLYHTSQIFEASGKHLSAYTSEVIVTSVNVAATITSALLVDRLGRRILLKISGSVMAASLIILGSYFYCKKLSIDLTDYSWIPLPVFVVYVFAFSLGFGPVPWLMLGEILPARIRGGAAALVTAFHWTSDLAVTFSFKATLPFIGIEGAFYMYSCFCVAAVLFTYFFVPETKRKTLEEIELLWPDDEDVISLPEAPYDPNEIWENDNVSTKGTSPIVDV